MAELVETTTSPRSCLRQIRSHPDFGSGDQWSLERILTPENKALLPAALEEANGALSPAPRDLALKSLVAAAALVMPASFTEADKKLWLAAAVQTLNELPADLLERGIRHARLIADHPSKIVPEIMKVVRAEWDRRKRDKANLLRLMDAAAQPEKPVEPSEPPTFTDEEVRDMPAPVIRVALHNGWLTQERIDSVRGEERSGAE